MKSDKITAILLSMIMVSAIGIGMVGSAMAVEGVISGTLAATTVTVAADPLDFGTIYYLAGTAEYDQRTGDGINEVVAMGGALADPTKWATLAGATTVTVAAAGTPAGTVQSGTTLYIDDDAVCGDGGDYTTGGTFVAVTGTGVADTYTVTTTGTLSTSADALYAVFYASTSLTAGVNNPKLAVTVT